MISASICRKGNLKYIYYLYKLVFISPNFITTQANVLFLYLCKLKEIFLRYKNTHGMYKY